MMLKNSSGIMYSGSCVTCGIWNGKISFFSERRGK